MFFKNDIKTIMLDIHMLVNIPEIKSNKIEVKFKKTKRSL